MPEREEVLVAAFPLLPERYWCEGTEGSTWDPVVLRARCEAHRAHAFDHKVDGMHPGVVLHLLDVREAALTLADIKLGGDSEPFWEAFLALREALGLEDTDADA